MQGLIKKFGQYEGMVYSLLVTYGEVDAQPVHIDCVYPEYMGAMLLTTGPKTDVFPVHEEMDIELGEMTCQDLATLICNRVGHRSKKNEDELARVLNDLTSMAETIKSFGYVLSSWESRNQANEKLLKSHPGMDDEETGYVGIMGSVCHSGPKSDGLRAVLYGSYAEQGNAEPYTGDAQFNSATFLAVILNDIVANIEVKLTCECMEVLLKLMSEVAKERFQESFMEQLNVLCDEAACLFEMVTEHKLEPKEVAKAYEWLVAKRGDEWRSLQRSEAVKTYEKLVSAKRKKARRSRK